MVEGLIGSALPKTECFPKIQSVVVEKISNGYLVFSQHYMVTEKVYVETPDQIPDVIRKMLQEEPKA